MTRFPTDGSTIDLQPLFFSLTLDSATEFLFGQSVDSLNSAEDSEQVKFGKDFDYAQNCLTMRSRLGKLVFLYRNKLFDQACQNVHAFVDEIVRTELARTPPEDAEKSNDGNGDANRYVFLTELVKSTRDPVRLRDELLNVLLAGRDTTASLLSNTFHALVRRPDIFRKLKAEIDQLNGEKPDYETLRNLKYLKQILNECEKIFCHTIKCILKIRTALRLYPVVPINARYAKEDTTIPLGGGPHGTSPLFIPRGALVAYSAYSMHRLQSIYGPDADIFRPERWDPSENLRPGWGYLPFNGGPRICVGQQFALTEASYTIVRLCQEYRIEDREGGEWIPKVALTTACGNGVKVVMEKI
jgi:cytochrome P450